MLLLRKAQSVCNMNRSAIGFGTFGGVMASVFPALILGDVLRTILLATIGAAVSFFVSLVLGIFFKRRR